MIKSILLLLGVSSTLVASEMLYFTSDTVRASYQHNECCEEDDGKCLMGLDTADAIPPSPPPPSPSPQHPPQHPPPLHPPPQHPPSSPPPPLARTVCENATCESFKINSNYTCYDYFDGCDRIPRNGNEKFSCQNKYEILKDPFLCDACDECYALYMASD